MSFREHPRGFWGYSGPRTIPEGGWGAWPQYSNPHQSGTIQITLPPEGPVTGTVAVHARAITGDAGRSTINTIDIYTSPPAGQAILIGTLTPVGNHTYTGFVTNWNTTTAANGTHKLVAFAVTTLGSTFCSVQIPVVVNNVASGAITITSPVAASCGDCFGGGPCSNFTGQFDASHSAGVSSVDVWIDGVFSDTLDYSPGFPTTITGDFFTIGNVTNLTCQTFSMYLILNPVTGASVTSATVVATHCNNTNCPP